MAYEFLQKLFGTPAEGEAPKAMTYAELETAIDKDKDIKLVNAKDGAYVPKSEYDAKVTELGGVQEQLNTANNTIKGFDGKSAEDIKKEISNWEQKYNTDTNALKRQLEEQARTHAEDMFLTGYKFTSKAARNGILAELRAKNFKVENGSLLGAKEYVDTLMSDDEFKGAFVIEDAGNDGNNNSGERKPRFSQGSSGGGESGGGAPKFNFGFAHIREPERKN